MRSDRIPPIGRPPIELIYQERFPLNLATPRLVRDRVRNFGPLLREQTNPLTLLCSEAVTAFLRHNGASDFRLRLFQHPDRFRVELADHLTNVLDLRSPADQEGSTRLRVLDGVASNWGVLGDGVSIIWFEVLRV